VNLWCLIPLLSLLASASTTSEFTAARIVDKEMDFCAVVLTVPAEYNRGFAILDVPSKTEGDDIRAHWDPAKHAFIINGGYFNADFSPTGFCRIDGKTIGKAKSEKLSGFVALDKSGAISLLTRRDDLIDYPTVVQSGPYVIDPGGKVGIESRSGMRARRTLIGVTSDKDLIIVVTEPIFLLDLAYAIKKHLPAIERLLNLDGGPSTALVTGSRTVVNRWPVRNYLVKRREVSDEPDSEKRHDD